MASSGSHKMSSSVASDEGSSSKKGSPRKRISTGNDSLSFLEAGPSKSFTSSTVEPSTSKAGADQRKKYSMRKLSVEASMDIPLNDDCNELNEEKEKSLAEQEKSSKQNDQKDVSHDLDLSFIEKMTPTDLQEHIAYCVKLTTENKINTKNAFALKLIDVMTVLKKEDKSNFAAMACQLDAGAKIYSSRVDAVYHDAVKLVEQCILNDKKKKAEKNDDSNDDEDKEGDTGKEKKKKPSKKVLASKDQISRRPMEADPKNKFIKLEAQPGGILNKVHRNREDLSLTLEKHIPFWVDLSVCKPVTAKGECSIPAIRITNRSIIPKGIDEASYTKFEPLLGASKADVPDSDEESDNDFIPSSQPNDYSYQLQTTNQTNQIDDSEPDNSASETEAEPAIISIAKMRMASEGSSKPSTKEIVKTLFHNPGESDYHYLKLKSSEYWAGPEYWLRQKGPNLPENKKKVIKRKKEPVEVMYSEGSESTLKESAAGKKAPTLSKKTMAKWSKKRVTYPQDLHFNPEILSVLHNAIMVAEVRDEEERTSLLESEVKNNDENCNTSQSRKSHCSSPDIFADTDSVEEEDIEQEPDFKGFASPKNCAENFLNQLAQCPEDDANPELDFQGFTSEELDSARQVLSRASVVLCDRMYNINGEDLIRGEDLSDESKDLDSSFNKLSLSDKQIEEVTNEDYKSDTQKPNCDTLEGENLVPMVKTVKVDPIRIVAKPNRVDMQHLKSVMLNIILRKIEDTENKLKDEGVPSPRGSVMFREVLTHLFNCSELHRRTQEDLTTQMAFLCLLTLINENNFHIRKNEEDDFLIMLEK